MSRRNSVGVTRGWSQVVNSTASTPAVASSMVSAASIAVLSPSCQRGFITCWTCRPASSARILAASAPVTTATGLRPAVLAPPVELPAGGAAAASATSAAWRSSVVPR